MGHQAQTFSYKNDEQVKRRRNLTNFSFVQEEMAMGWFFAIFGWIVRAVKNYLSPIEAPTDDLEEIARDEVKQSLKEIRRRNIHEIDAKPIEKIEKSRTRSLANEIPKSTESFIEFNAKEVLQDDAELVFGGSIYKSRVAIKIIGCNQDQVAAEIKIAERLKNHENFLFHFFSFTQKRVHFIAMEYYERSLFHFLPPDLRDFLKQMCNGLEHLHALKIAHKSLVARNIAVVMRGNTAIYKITNFRDSISEADEELLKDDVEALGKLLLKQRDRLQSDVHSKKWGTSDDVLCVALINKMTAKDWNLRPSIKKVKTHPFLWSAHETLYFIVEIAKKLESNKCFALYDLLKKNSSRIFTSDWRGYVDRYVIDELREINFDKLPIPNIIGLIKTIRNLVSSLILIFKDFYLIFFLDCPPQDIKDREGNGSQ